MTNFFGKDILCFTLISLLLPVFLLTGCGSKQLSNKKYVYQISTIDTLGKGGFEGDTEIHDILEHGDQGLGTFNDIDGEMIVYNGVVYKANFDGSLGRPERTKKTPFAVITEFSPDYSMEIESRTCGELKSDILRSFSSRELIRALQLKGEFEFVRYRSVKKQSKPFPSLSKVIKEQNVMHEYNTEGISVGFWFPEDFRGVNATGFHLHFLNNEMTRGGHVLDCKLRRGIVYIDNKKDIIISIN